MKTKLIALFALVALLFTTFSVPTLGDDPIYVLYNGEEIIFDVNPTIINGRTLVPMRAIFETFGAIVNYDSQTKTITATRTSQDEGTRQIILNIGNKNSTVSINGITKGYVLDVEPIVINGRTLVPLRFIGEALGAIVNWDGEIKTVTIVLSNGSNGIIPNEVEMILNWNVGSSGPKTLDPGLNSASDGGDVINHTFEGLVREIDGKIQPGIAKEWTISDDGKVYTFTLRNMNWSDGTKLTASDFVYSWKRAMDPETASGYQFIWEYTNVVGAYEAAYEGGSLDAVGIKAIDEITFEVTLNSPADYFLGLIAFYHFMPVKQSSVEAGPEGVWAKDPALSVSSGPYKLESYAENEKLVLVKNDEYWNKKNIKITKINGFFIDDQSIAYSGYKAGELDILPDVPPSQIQRLIAEDPEFHVFPLLGTYYYSFNLEKDIFKDVKVRKALALAINRKVICETLAAGQVPAIGFIPQGFLDNQGRDFSGTAGTFGFATDDSKVADAKALLAEAGYPNGVGFPKVTILFNSSVGHNLIAELIKGMWKVNLGINVEIANQEWAVFHETRTQGDFDIARGGWLTDYGDPIGLLSIFTSNSIYNDPRYFDNEYDAFLEKAENSNGAEHFEALYDAQDKFMTDVPIIPIYHYSDLVLAKSYLKEWGRSILGIIDFTKAYIEK